MNPHALKVLDSDQAGSYRPPRGGRAVGKLLSWQASLLDKAALRVMERLFVSGDYPEMDDGLRARLDWLADTYASDALVANPAAFYRPPDAIPEMRRRRLSTLSRGARFRLTWESGYQPFHSSARDRLERTPKNNIVSAHYWRHDHGDAPLVLCFHPWCGGNLVVEERLFAASALYEAGYDVALITLPYHGSRKPRSAKFSGQLFPSADLVRTNEGFGQAIFDARSLIAHVRAKGRTGRLGVMGVSLGGYVASLFASLEPDLAFAIPIIAPSSFADVLWSHGASGSSRENAEAHGVTLGDLRTIWRIHSPLSHELQLAKSDVLIISARGDAIIRPAQSEALWRHWEEPRLSWVVGSHLAQSRWLTGGVVAPLGKLDFMRHALHWLGARG